MAYMMYRETTLGTALNRTLEEFVEEGLITRPLAMKVLTTFDKNINKALAFRVKNKVQFKADKLVTYRYCDNVWTFVIDGVEFRDVHRSIDRTVNSVGVANELAMYWLLNDDEERSCLNLEVDSDLLEGENCCLRWTFTWNGWHNQWTDVIISNEE
ncbi:Transcription initiation factor IIA, gamma subunit, helical domain protein [Necator americanus]|uniref:Transcription initiation factor IIA, gamma subunit, helical domain protein n=1 Tax=Necator americanus TaxID=51031 RepID=W2SJN9_NECAM|nr:Transcription initiation factor IIA, gamma subunit, helical domain protein [Necator americanus]ETN69753.1 Transcription initiation factor IIA, gamma subunit, helical domain protein [Necator americanus]